MKTAVVYWSGTGNTEAMAGSVAEGAKSAGAEVSVFTVDGAVMAGEGVICNEAPDDTATEQCVALGKALAS